MVSTEPTNEAGAAEFAAVVLASLTEAVRRALTEHMRRGEKVPEWDGSAVVWVDPGKHPNTFPVRELTDPVPTGAVQVVPTDTPTASRLERG